MRIRMLLFGRTDSVAHGGGQQCQDATGFRPAISGALSFLAIETPSAGRIVQYPQSARPALPPHGPFQGIRRGAATTLAPACEPGVD